MVQQVKGETGSVSASLQREVEVCSTFSPLRLSSDTWEKRQLGVNDVTEVLADRDLEV